MNRNNLALIGVVAFLVIGLGLTALLLMQKNAPVAPAQNAAPPPEHKVWVAKQDIFPRTVITPAMLTEDTSATPAPDAITDPNQVLGKMASAAIYKGSTVTNGMMTEPLHRVIPANISIPAQDLRGVAIWVDSLQTAAGLVDKGDRVDVIAAHKLKYRAEIGEGELMAGRTIAQDLEVIAVDRSISAGAVPTPVPNAAPGAAPAPPAPPPAPPQPGQKVMVRVLLAAPPETAERLVAANLSGELHLTIRDPRARDNSPIVEAREYPVHTIDPAAIKIRDAAVQDAIEARRQRRNLAFSLESQRQNARLTKQLTPLIPIPHPTEPLGGWPTPMPEVREITVVRGTEKTRVVVPR